jgi:hypothetical protein
MRTTRTKARHALGVSVEFPAADIAHRRRWTGDIRAILLAVPDDDISGLARVLVMQKLVEKRRELVGLYVPRDSNRGAEIHLSAGIMSAPFPFSLLAVARRPSIALVLLHEVGHHCHFKRHGIRKPRWESWADEYRDRMGRRLFPWRMGVSGFVVWVARRPISFSARILLRKRRRREH